MSYVYKPNSLHVAQFQKKKKFNEKFLMSSKVDWSQILFKVSNWTFFFQIGQVEYGVFALVVQALDSAIQQINHYTVDKYWEN